VNELYFDNNATTPLDEHVLAGVQEALAENYGNPSSPHPLGERALQAVDRARASLVKLVGAASPREIIFTSGGTESIHTALHIALAEQPPGVVLTSSVEHAAVVRPLEARAAGGTELCIIGVDTEGRLDTTRLLEQLAARRGEVRLVSLLLANNETGVLLPANELGAIAVAAREAEALVHLDAVQAPGKLPFGEYFPYADLISLSAHKFHGPKGSGALFVRSDVGLPARGFLSGGPQEEERRAGTLNVPGIVGMGLAAERALEHLRDPEAAARVERLRDRIEAGLLESIAGLRIHGAGAPRLSNTTNVGLQGVDGELLHLSLAAEGLCVAGGAACSSKTRKPSPVLLEMGIDAGEARASLRFSLSHRTTPEEVEAAIATTCRVVRDLETLSLD
jgi:cysteine desulfurase